MSATTKSTTTTPRTLNSTGCIASIIGAPPAKIIRTAEGLGIRPDMTINGVAHFCDEAVERIAEHLRQNRGEK